MIFNIIKSLGITTICSLAIALILYFFGQDFIKSFILSAAGIFVLGFLLGTISETIMAVNNKKLENDRIKEFVKQGTLTTCAYCEEENFIPIRLDARNEFECDKCKQKNSVHVSIASSRITTPMTGSLNVIPDEKE